MKRNKLVREVLIRSAFDKRSNNPKKDYGIGACRIFFIVKGKKGAIVVNFGTNWYLPSTIKEYKEGIYRNSLALRGKESFKTKIDLQKDSEPITAWSWDCHSLKRTQEYEWKRNKCEFTGKHCYGDGSHIRAEDYLTLLFEKGSEGVFKQLEKDYKRQFERKVRRKG